MKLNQITCDLKSTRSKTREGFLNVLILAGKIGVQQYTCDELGLPDVNGTGLVKVARLSDEVFSQTSLDTMAHIDITNLHPRESLVTADNYKIRSVGHLKAPGTKENDHILVPGIVKDSATISDIENGKSQVSMGYTADYEQSKGTLDSEPYDFVQRNIIYNHLAIVPKGRAKTAVILDEDLTVDKDELAKKDAEISLLKKQLSDKNTLDTAALDEATELRAGIILDAQKLAPEIETKGKSNEAIKREVLGDKVTTTDSVDIVDYAFRQAVVGGFERQEHRDIDWSHKNKTTSDADKARGDYLKSLNNEGEK